MIRGLNVIARLNIPCGISIAARAVLRALVAGGVNVAVYNLDGTIDGREADPLPGGMQYVRSLAALPYEHTLFLCHFNEALLLREMDDVVLRKHHTATIFYWELETIPRIWHAGLRSFDTIFAPSTFVQRAVQNSLGLHAPLVPVVPVTDFNGVTQRASGRPFTFHMSFDLMSSFARKNPLASISAFVNAFPVRDDVRFVAKIWESEGCYLDRAGLEKSVRDYPHVQFIFDDLSYAQTLQLIADSDVYVSLHRGEGLGLGMLEAMSAGRPVVATNYGANTDYLSAMNGMPIPFTLEPVDAPEPTYQPDVLGAPAMWARADSRSASLAMRELHAKPAVYERLASAARRTYEQRRAALFDLGWLWAFERHAAAQLVASSVG